MIVQLSRFVLATAGALAGLGVKDLVDWKQTLGFPEYLVIILFIILGCSIGFIFGGIIGRELTRAYLFIEDYLRRMSIGDLLLATSGLVVGFLIALFVSTPIRLIEPTWIAVTGTVMMFIVLGYAGVRIAMLKRADFARLVPRVGDVPPRAQGASRPKLLDTSALIDGRFAELVRGGYVEGDVRVPGFVLSELQALADSGDETKRARGRRGLDLLATLRTGDHVVSAFEADYPELSAVDDKLLRLGMDTGGTIVTVDHNLAQVAKVSGVGVLNINELASALRPNHLPGERLRIFVAKEGKEPEQGVGYLEDGTMVVVQDGRAAIGSEADVVVTSVLQTSAGRMLFTKVTAP